MILYSRLASFIAFKKQKMTKKIPLNKGELIADYPLPEFTHDRRSSSKKFQTTKAKRMKDEALDKVKKAHESGDLSAIDNGLDAFNEILKEITGVPAYERNRIVLPK